MSEATICPGIVGCDGIVRGRITDIELFQAFNIDMCEARDFETGKYLLDETTRRRLARKPNGGDLWKVYRRKHANVSKTLDTPQERELRVAALAAKIAQGSLLFADSYDDGGMVNNPHRG